MRFFKFTRSVVSAVGALSILWIAVPSYAQYTETEPNNTRDTATPINLGTATSATITGVNSTVSGVFNDFDHYRITTGYETPGIYLNQLQISNPAYIERILGAIPTNTSSVFSSSLNSGNTPLGLVKYYSFGGAGKTQAIDFNVLGTGATSGASYTVTYSSSLVAATDLGTFSAGRINLSALANVGVVGGNSTVTDTEVIVLDSNYNVYYDNTPGSSTNGLAAMNNNPVANVPGFALNRFYEPGTYYIAVSYANLATNDAAPSDEKGSTQSVLHYPNVMATSFPGYNGLNGSVRPADFSITDSAGKTFSTSGEAISTMYGINFYSFTVSSAAVVPEPGSLFLLAGGIGAGAVTFGYRRGRARRSS